MRHALLSAALGVLFVACRPAAAPPAPVTAPLEQRVPAEIGPFRQVERDVLAGGAGTSFRFRDTSAVYVTVIIYDPEPHALARHPEPRDLVRHEGETFGGVLDFMTRRGDYSETRMLATAPDSVRVGSRLVAGHVATARGVRRARPVIELQYVYLLDERFVKVRATVPEASWPRDDLHPVVTQLVSALAR